jgi:hypothetical protein
MPAREKYRKKAEIIQAQAELIRDVQRRAVLLTIAQNYLKLSETIAARQERGTAHPPADDQRPSENDSV